MRVPGSAKYRGKPSDIEVGMIMGPTTYGSLLTVEELIYDEATNTTTAYFRNTTQDDYPKPQIINK